MTSLRHGSRTHTIHTDTYRPGRQVFSSLTHTDTQLGGGGGRLNCMYIECVSAKIRPTNFRDPETGGVVKGYKMKNTLAFNGLSHL